MVKICIKCNEVKSKWNSTNVCRECANAQNRKSYKLRKLHGLRVTKHKGSTDVRKRSILLKYKYGITHETYLIMYNSQSGKCAICKDNYKLLHVDHCHSTGKVRGLLCPSCNTGLGKFKDNIFSLKNAVNYLKESGHE